MIGKEQRMGLGKTVLRFLTLAVFSQCITGEEWEQLKYSTGHIGWMRTAQCTNLAEVYQSIGFPNSGNDPYPGYGYDTGIDPNQSCFVVFPDEDERDQYRLENGTPEEMAQRNVTTKGRGTHFLTHGTPCGACSDLSNLAVYLDVTDLTNPVRDCGFKLIKDNAVECLGDIGFTGHCKYIWYYNTANTKKTAANGGCFGTCFSLRNAPNIEEVGTDNPCDPNVCSNTINNGPACSNDQWQNGPYRLNACLQCDECRSGPIFQKVAGRTRRASGIPSAIARPPGDVQKVTHVYGKWVPPTPRPSASPLPYPSPMTNPPVSPTPETLRPTFTPTLRPSPRPTFRVTNSESEQAPLALIMGLLGACVLGGGAVFYIKSNRQRLADQQSQRAVVVSPEEEAGQKAMVKEVVKFGF